MLLPRTRIATLLATHLILLLACHAAAHEKRSLANLQFRLNANFLVNTHACRLPAMSVDLEFPNPKFPKRLNRLAVATRAKDKRDQWLAAWQQKFRNKHYALINQGRGMKACVIWDPQQRRICCERRIKYKAKKKHSQLKFEFCMSLVHEFVRELFKTGVLLKGDDEHKLESQLNKLLFGMAKDRANGRLGSVSLASGDGDGGVGGSKEERRKIKEQNKFVRFLLAMKRMELLRLSKKKDALTEEQNHTYSEFIKAFERCYWSKKTAVFYQVVDKKWMTCGPVRFETSVSAYCADLSTLDPNAPELSREPIVRWESGTYEVMNDFTHRTLVPDLDKISREHDDDERTGIGGRQPVKSKIRKKIQRNEYTEVNLFGMTGYCRKADFSYSCYAICCDTIYAMSNFCRTRGLQCIG